MASFRLIWLRAYRNQLTNNATATGWVLWWTKACTSCPAANCSSSSPTDRIDLFLSTWAKTTCPGLPTRIRPNTCSGALTTCAPYLDTGPEVVPEAVGCPVQTSPANWRRPRPTRYRGLPVYQRRWYYTLEFRDVERRYRKTNNPMKQRRAMAGNENN